LKETPIVPLSTALLFDKTIAKIIAIIILRGDHNICFKQPIIPIYKQTKKTHTSIFPKKKKNPLQTYRKQESHHNINPTITPFEETFFPSKCNTRNKSR